ncbi:MAG: ABC transporter substrate-binding protein [Dongiaceae bacterium]
MKHQLLTGVRQTSPASFGLALGALVLAISPAWADEETLDIGFAAALSGYLAPFDQPALNGAQLAVEEINAGGGIDGKYMINLDVKDVRSETAQSAIAAQEFIDDEVDVLFVPCDNDPGIAAGSVAQANEVVSLSPCNSSSSVATAVGTYMFTVNVMDNLQGAVLAIHAREQGYQNAYLLSSAGTDYTKMLPQFFATAFQNKGGTIVGESSFTFGQQDFSAEVTAIRNTSPAPDVIMTAAYEPEFPAFLTQLRAAGVMTPVIASDGVDSPTTFSLGEVGEGVVFTGAGFPLEGSRLADFYANYEARYGHPPESAYTAVGYDAVRILEAAVIQSGALNGPALRDAIDNLENAEGSVGSITFKGQGRIPLREVSLTRVNGGEREYVDQFIPDAADVPPAN